MESRKVKKSDLERQAKLLLDLIYQYGEKMEQKIHLRSLKEIKFLQEKIEEKTNA